ncbi:hypothetical protein COHA_010589 [Chlorella ohadii]|uniref:SGNH hydrolase-type esterase domain-containing protein n=1 Tax=Chlorella ohadii TaxID=2649997 RepID=A0AAD5DHH0_9CHLO|nr:hypothetical protein COHA_010589 [Chlorella ohadii]
MRAPARGGRGGGFGGRGGGGRGGFGGRGGGRGFNRQPEGPPEQVVEAGEYVHPCEGEMVCKLTNTMIPYFNAPIFLENKTQVGKVDEILGQINCVLKPACLRAASGALALGAMNRGSLALVAGCCLILAACVIHLRCPGRVWLLGGFSGPEPQPTPRDDPVWQACHAQHVQEIAAADVADDGYHLLFYGDSITEEWAGADHCYSCLDQERCAGVPDVFRRHYAKWRAGAMAIGGDQTAHLLWRLRNGEAPQKNKPKVVVLLIGTNDLGAAAADASDLREAEQLLIQAVPGVTLRVLQTLHTLKDLLPDTHIVLMGVLPRGNGGPQGLYHWPSAFAQPIHMINAHFRSYAALDGHLHFVDCGDRLIVPGGGAIRSDLMQDALHPNAAGMELLAQCLDPLITKLMQRPAVVTASTRTSE